jgi:hypothetical protein
MLIALKCLLCQKIQKISNPPLGSYFVNEPNFCLINKAFLYDFVILKKVSNKNNDLLILGHPTYAGPPSIPHHQPNM